MKAPYWFVALILILMTANALADPDQGHVQAPAETPNRIDTAAQQPEPGSSPSAAPQRDTQEKLTSDPVKRFVPKEQIPADSAISSPSDI